MEILKQRDMKLLSRKRYTIKLPAEKETPSRLELIDKVAKELKVKKDQVVIKHIYPQFGHSHVKVIVHVYDDPKQITKFEEEHLIKRHQAKAEASE